jgi:hypothetical protein
MDCPLCAAKGKDWQLCADSRRYYICAICDLVWLDPKQRLSGVLELERYHKHQNSSEDPSYLAYLSVLAKATVSGLAPGSHGLDYGSGPVEGMRAILEPMGYRVDSYDPAFFPKQPRENYDFVLCSEVVEHFHKPALDWARLAKLLKTGARLGISSRLRVSAEEFSAWHYRRDPTHVSFFSEKSVIWISEHFGWKLLRLDSPIWIFSA